MPDPQAAKAKMSEEETPNAEDILRFRRWYESEEIKSLNHKELCRLLILALDAKDATIARLTGERDAAVIKDHLITAADAESPDVAYLRKCYDCTKHLGVHDICPGRPTVGDVIGSPTISDAYAITALIHNIPVLLDSHAALVRRVEAAEDIMALDAEERKLRLQYPAGSVGMEEAWRDFGRKSHAARRKYEQAREGSKD